MQKAEPSNDAYLPNEYISDQRQKLNLQTKFANPCDLTMNTSCKDELIDRFGEYSRCCHLPTSEIGLVKATFDQKSLVRLVEKTTKSDSEI